MIALSVDTKFISPYALSAFVALREKGVPFELHEVDIDLGAQHESGYVDASGTARIPMLEHDGFFLSESSAIAEYLDEAFPDAPPLLPRGVQERARARQVQAWLRSDLLGLRADRSTERVFAGERLPPLGADGRAAADKLLRFADALVPAADGNLFGAWSIADTDLATMLNRLVVHGDEVPAKLAGYATAQWRRPSVAAWLERMRR
ncbi:MAG: glutathione transferase [Xanthomonadaceae bacterium]|nr:glutathione transferase [Xanthomonadaceae bacterium]